MNHALSRFANLRFAFTYGLVAICGFLVLGLAAMAVLQRHSAQLGARAGAATQAELTGQALMADGLQMGQAIRNILLDPTNPKAYENRAAAWKAWQEHLVRWETLLSGDDLREIRPLFERIRDGLGRDATLQQELETMARGGNAAAALVRLNQEETKLWRAAKADLQSAQTAAQQVASALRNRAEAFVRWQQRASWSVVICLIVVASSFVALAVRLLRRSEHAVAEVAVVSAELDGDARMLRDGSASLADEASKQAAAEEEISAALHELDTVTRGASEHATELSARVAAVASEVGAAQSQMAELTGALEEIKQSGAEVSRIAKAINEIAFQTNLLALNASIEAARAGEAGAGFAVVADEVRALAHRSAEAARESEAKIEASVQRGERGQALCVAVASGFDKIAAGVNDADSRAAGIASATKQQTENLSQITLGLRQLDESSQATAARSEELAAASQMIEAKAHQLREHENVLSRAMTGRQYRDRGSPEAVARPSRTRARGSMPVDALAAR